MLWKTASFFAAIATALLFHSTTNPSYDYYHSLFLSPSLSSPDSIVRHLQTLTRRPHVAGSPANAAAARHVLAAFSAAGVDSSRLASYRVLLTRPVSRSLTLQRTAGDLPVEFSLEQRNHGGNPHAGEVLPTFHAYARSGTAVGPVVYARYGRVEDFNALRVTGVEVYFEYRNRKFEGNSRENRNSLNFPDRSTVRWWWRGTGRYSEATS